MDKKKLEELTADHELWDKRERGASAEHFALVSDEEQREIEEGLGLQSISLRLNRTLIDQFKKLAKVEGIGYQPLMRMVLTEYAKANEYKLVAMLPAAEAARRADNSFAEAIKLRNELSNLKPLSNERINAEMRYHMALNEAQSSFAQAVSVSENPVVLRHAKLRLQQIADICKQELLDVSLKKNGKKRHAV